ncbi:MAG: phosphoribosyl-ATP diphosphatase [Pseudomonadota bacterium]
MSNKTSESLDLLFAEIKQKMNGDAEKSYTAFLAKSGLKNITKKVIEEAAEVCEAALEKDQEQVVLESADLFFHTLVLLAAKDVELKSVIEELKKRRQNKDLSQKAISKNKIKLYGK